VSGLSIKGRNYLGYEIHIDKNNSHEEIIDFLDKNIITHSEHFRNFILTIKLDQPMDIDFAVEHLKKHGLYVSAVFVDNLKQGKNLDVNFLSEIANHPNSVVFKGNLRSGQTLESEDNLIILGNVNRDSYVYAKRNIFVLGNLDGIPHAGFNGDASAFVFAFELNSPQIRIGNILAKSPDTQKNSLKKEPEVAFVENEQIVVTKYKNWINYKME